MPERKPWPSDAVLHVKSGPRILTGPRRPRNRFDRYAGALARFDRSPPLQDALYRAMRLAEGKTRALATILELSIDPHAQAYADIFGEVAKAIGAARATQWLFSACPALGEARSPMMVLKNSRSAGRGSIQSG